MDTKMKEFLATTLKKKTLQADLIVRPLLQVTKYLGAQQLTITG
jgi:hypothetical protein